MEKYEFIMLVGVSGPGVDIPLAWRFYSHAQFEATSKESFMVRKDHVSTERYQGSTIRLVNGAYMGSPVDQTPTGE